VCVNIVGYHDEGVSQGVEAGWVCVCVCVNTVGYMPMTVQRVGFWLCYNEWGRHNASDATTTEEKK
jgi:hypothetical protein